MIRILIILSALLTLGLSRTVSAACLLGDYSISSEFERSLAVILGTVVTEQATPESNDLLDGVTYSVKTEETLRGKVSAIVDLFSENSSGRFPMVKGQQYVLFLYKIVDRLAVDNCGNSGPLAEKDDVLKGVRRLAKVAQGSQKSH